MNLKALDYAPAHPTPFAWRVFAGHLLGWGFGMAALWWASVYLVPKFEQIAADYKVLLPLPTMVLLGIGGRVRNGELTIVLSPFAFGHALAAAWWRRRAGRGAWRAYRLLLLLVTASLALFVMLGMFLPMVGLINSLAGGTGARK